LTSPRSLPTSPCELSEREVTSSSNIYSMSHFYFCLPWLESCIPVIFICTLPFSFWNITVLWSNTTQIVTRSLPTSLLLSPTSPCELSEREVTSPSNLKVVGALDNYSLVFVIFINFFEQLKDWVGQVLFLVSCPKGQVKNRYHLEPWYSTLMNNCNKSNCW
jgi:hypothetical protein